MSPGDTIGNGAPALGSFGIVPSVACLSMKVELTGNRGSNGGVMEE